MVISRITAGSATSMRRCPRLAGRTRSSKHHHSGSPQKQCHSSFASRSALCCVVQLESLDVWSSLETFTERAAPLAHSFDSITRAMMAKREQTAHVLCRTVSLRNCTHCLHPHIAVRAAGWRHKHERNQTHASKEG